MLLAMVLRMTLLQLTPAFLQTLASVFIFLLEPTAILAAGLLH